LPDEGRRLAQRIRHAVEGIQMGAGGKEVPLSLSIGFASLSDLESGDDVPLALIAAADARLDRAKSSGRNSVCRRLFGRKRQGRTELRTLNSPHDADVGATPMGRATRSARPFSLSGHAANVDERARLGRAASI
jgi:hypothetical protein